MGLNARTVIERNHLFRGLPAVTLDRIATLATRRFYGKGEVIFAQSDSGGGLYGLVTGRVRISASFPDGKELFLNIMEPGDSFGEIGLLDGHPRTATASGAMMKPATRPKRLATTSPTYAPTEKKAPGTATG